MSSKRFYHAAVVVWLAGSGLAARPVSATTVGAGLRDDGDVGGSVADSATGTPLPGGQVRIVRDGNTIATASTDAFGRFVIHNLPAGAYSVEVRYLGYRAETRDVSVAADEGLSLTNFRLVPLPINLSAVEVRSAHQHHVPDPAAIDRGRGAGADRRSPYPRPARRVHLLRRRCAGPRGDFRKPERVVRPAGRESDRLPNGRLGRGVRQQERRHRQRHYAHPVGWIAPRRVRLRRLVFVEWAGAEREHERRQVRVLLFWSAARDGHAAGARGIRHRDPDGRELSQRRYRSLRLRQGAVHPVRP
ncbi:MAG: hypothetical protein DMD67_08685 [Gemmatimonadetes bacterium]|nr:MAG: hypothetical protein DMD67_08685 [Gemmatimonadota bacterium]